MEHQSIIPHSLIIRTITVEQWEVWIVVLLIILKKDHRHKCQGTKGKWHAKNSMLAAAT